MIEVACTPTKIFLLVLSLKTDIFIFRSFPPKRVMPYNFAIFRKYFECLYTSRFSVLSKIPSKLRFRNLGQICTHDILWPLGTQQCSKFWRTPQWADAFNCFRHWSTSTLVNFVVSTGRSDLYLGAFTD